MKYLGACLCFLMGSEILSLAALTVMMCMFLWDILKERSVQHERF